MCVLQVVCSHKRTTKMFARKNEKLQQRLYNSVADLSDQQNYKFIQNLAQTNKRTFFVTVKQRQHWYCNCTIIDPTYVVTLAELLELYHKLCNNEFIDNKRFKVVPCSLAIKHSNWNMYYSFTSPCNCLVCLNRN